MGTSVSRPDPNQIWTPRRPEVNDFMYIKRPSLEQQLGNHMNGSRHVLLCGESGIGKSWMYKSICIEKRAKYLIADSANISRFGSFDKEFENLIARDFASFTQVKYKESKRAAGKVVIAEAEIGIEREYIAANQDKFLDLLQHMKKHGYTLLVFENFERIIETRHLIRHLGDLLTLLDNPDYAKYNVRFLLVGAVRDAARFFRETENQDTIANRIREIPIHKGLPKAGTARLCEKGFRGSLRLEFSDSEMVRISEHVHHLTMGIPQRIHEFCLELSTIMQDHNYKWTADTLNLFLQHAEVQWVRGHLMQHHTNLMGTLNHNNPDSRKNQLLYALGNIRSDQYRINTLEKFLRDHIPSLSNQALNIAPIMKSLSNGKNPTLRKISRGTYELSDGAMRMVIRAVLKLDKEYRIQIEDRGSIAH